LDLSAPHIGFVVASYAVSSAAILVLAISSFVKLRGKERILKELELADRRQGGTDNEP
jgi:hypothetical protein